MGVKIEEGKFVSNFCLADEFFKWLPPGTYYLTLMTPWNGPEQMPTQILLATELADGRISGMAIDEPVTGDNDDHLKCLKNFAERYGFREHGGPEVFILEKGKSKKEGVGVEIERCGLRYGEELCVLTRGHSPERHRFADVPILDGNPLWDAFCPHCGSRTTVEGPGCRECGGEESP